MQIRNSRVVFHRECHISATNAKLIKIKEYLYEFKVKFEIFFLIILGIKYHEDEIISWF